MKYTTTIILVIALAILAYWAGVKFGQLPQVIYQAPPNDENLLQWHKNWRKAGDSIVSATVVSNATDQLFVYVDYIYSGSHGDVVTTCGNIVRNGNSGGEWICSPTGIRKGRGFVTLRFGMSSSSRSIECSDAILVDFYAGRGVPFFKKIIPFQKTWVKDEEGLYGKIRETLSVCPPVK